MNVAACVWVEWWGVNKILDPQSENYAVKNVQSFTGTFQCSKEVSPYTVFCIIPGFLENGCLDMMSLVLKGKGVS